MNERDVLSFRYEASDTVLDALMTYRNRVNLQSGGRVESTVDQEGAQSDAVARYKL
jgi:hypothetical protein